MSTTIELDEVEGQLTARVNLGGELDVAHVAALQEELLKVEKRTDREFEILCESLEYIDPSGMQLLLALKNECEANQHSFRITGMTESLTQSCELMGLGTLLNLN